MAGRFRLLLALVLCTNATVEASHALSLYAVIPEAGTLRGQLWLVDPVNGNQLVGRPVTQGLSGLAATSTGALYASTFVTGAGSSLIRIDPEDGSLLGSVAIVGSLGTPLVVTDLAMQPGTDALYATTVPTDGLAPDLFQIDVTTGVATLVGDTGILSSGESAIGFAPDGTLYFADFDQFTFELKLWRLDPTTGQQIGPGVAYAGGNGSLAVGPNGKIYANPAFCCGGAVYEVDPSSPASASIYAILPVGTIGDLAFVPEPSALSLALAALALLPRRPLRRS